MIKYLKHNEIDKRKWDDCVRFSVNGIIYAYSWYLDVVCPDWEALVEGDYERILPLTWRKKNKIFYLFQPVFSQQLGVFSRSFLSDEIVDKFLNAIPSKFKLIEINLNTYNKTNNTEFKRFQQITHELDLIDSYKNIFAKYSTNTKRNIKKAIKSNITISQNVRPEEIIKIFRENRGKDINVLKDSDYQVLSRLMYLCLFKSCGNAYGAYTEQNELCAGAFFIQSNKKAIFLFSGVNRLARESGAMSLLIDSFIKNNSQTALTLDFEGSMDKNLARFYKSFGSTKCNYLHIKRNSLPFFVKLGVRIIKALKKV